VKILVTKIKKLLLLTITPVVFGLFISVTLSANAEIIEPESIIFTELMPNIEDNDRDWIELFNTTQAVIDLKGCIVFGEKKEQFTIEKSVIIEPNSYIIIASEVVDKVDTHAVLNNFSYQFPRQIFQLSTGPDQVILSCGGVVIDRVNYKHYTPGPATGSRGWQLSPNSLSAKANDDISNWCYTNLPILSEINLNSDGSVASPGRENPVCGAKVLPYLYINNQQAVLIDGIDFDQTLAIAREEFPRNLATSELTIWALRDQVITPQIAQQIAILYFDNIDQLYQAKPVAMLDWNHAVWHFAWAIANLYRNGDEAVKIELKAAYEDALTRPQTLEKFQLVAVDHVLGHDISMGSAHERGHAFAQAHIVVPGNSDYVQSFEQYLNDRPSDFKIAVINILYNVKIYFGGLFD
jgi:hypothetical protein